MRVLIAGDWHSKVHEEAVFHALISLGHVVDKFKWYHYFETKSGVIYFLQNVVKRLQNKYLIGPLLHRVQNKLLTTVKRFQPEMVFIYRGTHITPNTLIKIKEILPHCVLVGYNNDDPFSVDQPSYYWRHFVKALPHYDLILAYRHINMSEYLCAGAKKVELLRSWYIPPSNSYSILNQEVERKEEFDVVFVGHYEDDGRIAYLEEIVRQGIKLHIYGPTGWDKSIKKSLLLRHLAPIRPVWGDDYNRILRGAKIALCFFSKLNRDTYTRRCFEIPSLGTLLLSEYSPDLATLYRQGEEADFFVDIDEMINKIHYYLKNGEVRMKIARAGRERVISDGHDVVSRVKKVIDWVQDIQISKG